jgi:hypothetical protein
MTKKVAPTIPAQEFCPACGHPVDEVRRRKRYIEYFHYNPNGYSIGCINTRYADGSYSYPEATISAEDLLMRMPCSEQVM